MKDYIWLDSNERPLTRAWPYQDEAERMAAGPHPPPAPDAVPRAGTREPLMERLGLRDADLMAP